MSWPGPRRSAAGPWGISAAAWSNCSPRSAGPARRRCWSAAGRPTCSVPPRRSSGSSAGPGAAGGRGPVPADPRRPRRGLRGQHRGRPARGVRRRDRHPELAAGPAVPAARLRGPVLVRPAPVRPLPPGGPHRVHRVQRPLGRDLGPMLLMNRLFGDWAARPYAAMECHLEGLDRLGFEALIAGLGDEVYDRRTGRGRLIVYAPGRIASRSGLSYIALGRTRSEARDWALRGVPELVGALIARLTGRSGRPLLRD